MASLLIDILSNLKELSIWLIGLLILFGILARLTPCNPSQPYFKKGAVTDTVYFFLVPIATRFINLIYTGLGIFIVFHGVDEKEIYNYLKHGFGPIGKMPLWWQAAVSFMLSDIILYWTHRWFHGRAMWPFHAIHHSSEHVDWHSTYRFHPVNIWLSFTLVDTLMLFSGFSLESVAVLSTFNMLYSAMVHANLNWTFGPFRYVFSSPVFHRWHHTAQREGMDKNFAPTFPLLDILFGTFYMPENRVPEQYGIPGSNIPESFWGQMIWPFKNRA